MSDTNKSEQLVQEMNELLVDLDTLALEKLEKELNAISLDIEKRYGEGTV